MIKFVRPHKRSGSLAGIANQVKRSFGTHNRRGIVKRVCFDWLDAKRRTMIPFSSISAAEFDVKDVAQENQQGECQEDQTADLHEAMSELPTECREVVQLYYSGKMTYQELGDMLDVSAATINARLTRARAMLRERLMPRLETRS